MGTMTDERRDQIRAALGTSNFANETRSDFDDLMPSTTRRRYVSVSDHTRIVAGADDLVHPMAGRGNGGGVARSTPVIPDMKGHAIKDDEDTTLAPRDLRTERQIEVMTSLVNQLGELDMEGFGLPALEYTVRMTREGKWTPGKGGNASAWIGRMIAKVRELKAAQLPEGHPIIVEVFSPAGNVQHDELPFKKNKNDRPMPMYYAVEIDGVTKFYRVKQGTKPGWWWIDAQASNEFHPVRNVATKNTILRAIIDQGAEECLRNYGRLIGSCGRCHTTLTDETSRANGIGPDCEGKM